MWKSSIIIKDTKSLTYTSNNGFNLKGMIKYKLAFEDIKSKTINFLKINSGEISRQAKE